MRAYAKINLSLDVLQKRPDNYHEINSVMQQINLYDELDFKESDDIVVQSDFKDDIILKTAMKLKELFNVKEGVKISVKKNIPVGAGLAGGSADAAATLISLNILWDLNLSTKDLIKIGAELGADIPFCIEGGCCFVSGIGEITQKLEGTEMDVVLVNSGYQISTKDAYSELDSQKLKISEGLEAKPQSEQEYENKESSLSLKNAKTTEEIAALLHNDFISIQKDDVKNIINELKNLGALNASITGKGPTVFGIFKDDKKAKNAYEKLRDKYDFVHHAKTLK